MLPAPIANSVGGILKLVAFFSKLAKLTEDFSAVCLLMEGAPASNSVEVEGDMALGKR